MPAVVGGHELKAVADREPERLDRVAEVRPFQVGIGACTDGTEEIIVRGQVSVQNFISPFTRLGPHRLRRLEFQAVWRFEQTDEESGQPVRQDPSRRAGPISGTGARQCRGNSVADLGVGLRQVIKALRDAPATAFIPVKLRSRQTANQVARAAPVGFECHL